MIDLDISVKIVATRFVVCRTFFFLLIVVGGT